MFARKRLVHTLLFVLIAIDAALGQSPASGTALISFQTPKVTFIAPMESPAVRVIDAASSGDIGRTQVRVRALNQGSTITIPFVARSNTSYRLAAKLVHVDGSTSLPILVKSVVASSLGSGARLSNGATEVRSVGSVDLTPFLETIVVEGSRISRGGNNGSADNAIVLQLTLEVPAGVIAADLALTMYPVS